MPAKKKTAAQKAAITSVGLLIPEKIAPLVHVLRHEKVILDSDLAELYGVTTKVLNRAVQRNIDRFPPDFMAQLTEDEWENLRSQIATSRFAEPDLKSQSVIYLKLLDEAENQHSQAELRGITLDRPTLFPAQAKSDLGQFRTPRQLRQFMVQLVDPDIGDTIYDPACGTAGFIVEALDHILAKYSSETREIPIYGEGWEETKGFKSVKAAKIEHGAIELPFYEILIPRMSGFIGRYRQLRFFTKSHVAIVCTFHESKGRLFCPTISRQDWSGRMEKCGPAFWP